ncbi:hypothetical protein Tco_1058160 [Tanacetum coccineum]|uniref:Reverse transcriptase domain-containing protein n=1 Tax=Tanacetum coccineum TaxID=301880 RepID=A0ABQ5H7X3_9ASTR
MINKMNIKFRGGLLGIKSFYKIIYKDNVAEELSTASSNNENTTSTNSLKSTATKPPKKAQNRKRASDEDPSSEYSKTKRKLVDIQAVEDPSSECSKTKAKTGAHTEELLPTGRYLNGNVENIRKGLKMNDEEDEDKDEIKGLIWVNNHTANIRRKDWASVIMGLFRKELFGVCVEEMKSLVGEGCDDATEADPKVSVTQDIGARAAVHIFNRISFVIAKGVATQLGFFGSLGFLLSKPLGFRSVAVVFSLNIVGRVLEQSQVLCLGFTFVAGSRTHTLRSKCRHGNGSDFLSPPNYGDGVVRFVLYDLTKPQVPSCSEQLDHVCDEFATFLKRTLAESSPTLSDVDDKDIDFGEQNIKQCKMMISDGHYTAAVRVLSSSSVAPYSDATLEDLKTKHPFKPAPSLPHIPFDHHHLIASPIVVLDRIKSFPHGTSYGRDGLRAQHLIDCLSGSTVVVSDELVSSITQVVNLFLDRSCPKMLGEYISSASLTPLVKLSGGIRPIAVGTVWRRLVSKVSALMIGHSLDGYLDDLQFDVGVSGGSEAILYVDLDFFEAARVLEAAQLSFDMALRSALERIVTASGPGFEDWQWRLATLRFAFGGLGVYSAGDVLNYAFIASRLQSAALQTKLLRHVGLVAYGSTFDDALCIFNASMEIDFLGNPSEIAAPKLMKKMADIYFTRVAKDAESSFSLSPRQMALWLSQREEHTSDWLRVVPISGLGQTMNGKTYRCVLCYRLGVPLFSVSKPCSACSKVFIRDVYGDHAVSCAGVIGIKHRHNAVRDTLVDICFRSGISAGKEVDIGLSGDGDKALRPADILLYSWDGGLDVCVDLTGSSPLTRTGMTDFAPGRVVIDAAQRKRGKYLDKCAAIGYGFLPFSFSSLGELEANAVTLLKRIRKFSMVQDIGARAAIHIFNRISFAIAKGVGAQIVSRLPSNLL